MEVVRGYKVFNPDWKCRDKQYTCPGKFKEDVEPECEYSRKVGRHAENRQAMAEPI